MFVSWHALQRVRGLFEKRRAAVIALTGHGGNGQRPDGLERLEPRLLLSGTPGAEQAIELFHTSPAVFIENRGQWEDDSVRFVHQGRGANIAHTDAGPIFELYRDVAPEDAPPNPADESFPPDRLDEAPAEMERLRFSASFDGADVVSPVGLELSESRFNFLIGDPAQHRTDVPGYGVVAYEGLYPGVDLHTWGQRDSLKYEFHVDPGADWSQISVSYEGIEGLSIDEDGSLHVELPDDWGHVVDDTPYIYQLIDGREVEVAGEYQIVDQDTYTFAITGEYDASRELIIDPDLAWSTYLGGSSSETGRGIAVDAAGSVLISGRTNSSGWVSGGFDASYNGGDDAFVTKLSASGAHLWSTYLGGSDSDNGSGVAVDAAGSVLITGQTGSSGWVSGGFDTSHNGGNDAFVAKLSSAGAHLWSTYLGGSEYEYGWGVAVDAARNVLITGQTFSSGWVSGGFDASYNGGDDAFVTKLSASGAHLWSTYLGGSDSDNGSGVAVDAAGSVLITGQTGSSGWVSGGFDTSHNGGNDAFVAKLSSAGAHLWSTYLGGSEYEYGGGVAVDAAGGVYVTGVTESFGWISGGFDTSHNGGNDAFVAKLSSAGAHLWSTYLGGSSTDQGSGVAVDAAGSVLITGWTYSSGWVSGGFDTSFNQGSEDAFVAKLSSSGAHLWSTYLGGSDYDWGIGIAVDGASRIYVTGFSHSSGWTSGGFDTSHNGGDTDAFVAKIGGGGGGGSMPNLWVDISHLTLTPESGSQRVTADIHNIGSSGANNVKVRFRDLDTGTVVSTETIATLGSFTSQSASTLWTPQGPGSRIEVQVDPFDQIAETSNTDNEAVAVYGSGNGGDPIVNAVTAQWDGDSDRDAFGRFVSGVELWNTFTANVLDPDGASDIDQVMFTLGALGSRTDDDSHGGWTADFNMGELTGDTTLEVVAYDSIGNTSSTWSGVVNVAEFPSWLGEMGDDDYFSGGHYHLNGFFPEELDMTHTMPSDWWIVGDKQSSFRLGVELGVTAGLDARKDVPIDHEFVFEAQVLDYDVFGYSGDPLDLGTVGGVDLSFSGLAEGSDLSLTGFDAQLDTGNLSLFSSSITGPSTTVLVPVGFVPIPVTVSTGINFDLELDAVLNLGADLVHDEVTILEGTHFQPSVSAEPYLFGGVGIPGLNGGLEVGGELGLHYQGEFDSIGGYEDYLWGDFQLNFRAVATAGKKFTLAEWTVPGAGDPPWAFGSPPPGVASMNLETLTTTGDDDPVVLPEPGVAADSTGQVLVARVSDGDVVQDGVQADVFYALRDATGTWSTLSPVSSADTIDSDPVIAFDGQGGAAASWVANDTDPALVESMDWGDYLSAQEVHSSYWNGASWSAPQAVTSDSQRDGSPRMAFHNGEGLMLWDRATGAESTNRTGYEVMYAVWDDATHTWGTPQALTSDSAGDWSPVMAYGPDGTAIAAWVHDEDPDSEPTTAELYYAIWDGSSWTTPTAVPIGSTAGVREPKLGFDSAGNALLAWIGNEGHEDLLYTATWDGGAWSAPELVADTPHFIEGLDLAISPSDEATLTWHGWDGQHDLFSTTRDLAGGDWRTPERITDNTDDEWMVSTAFDSAGVLQSVWANEQATSVFGEGAEGVALQLASNLTVADVELMADHVVEGEEARLLAEVTNTGWAEAAATQVQFYRGDPDDGGTLIGAPIDIGGLLAGESQSVLSDIFTLPIGASDLYARVVAVAGESDAADNTGVLAIDAEPADTIGPQVTVLELQTQPLPEGTDVLTLEFDEPVTGVFESDVSLVEQINGTTPPDHVYLSPDGDRATLIFEGGLPVGSYELRVLDQIVDSWGNPLDGDNDGSVGGQYVRSFTIGSSSTAVISRHIFYNNSSFDEVSDDDAIAPDKSALLPGEAATFASYTSYSRGINGVMVDVDNLADAGNLSAADFTLKTGNSADPGGWSTYTGAVTVSVREGEGAGGSDRVTLIMPDGAIAKTWLQVTMQANATTGLAADDVFYFGNAIGETGNSAADAMVNGDDVHLTRDNQTGFGSATVDNAYDFNRDGKVNVGDVVKARVNRTDAATPLALIDLADVIGSESIDLLEAGVRGDAPQSIDTETARRPSPNAAGHRVPLYEGLPNRLAGGFGEAGDEEDDEAFDLLASIVAERW